MNTASVPAPRFSLVPLLAVNFIGALGYSLVIPLMVYLVDDLSGSTWLYGWVAAVYPGFQLIGAPVLGRWSDNIGRRKVLLISQIGTLAAWVILLAALFLPVQELGRFSAESAEVVLITLPLLLVVFARALDGLTGGNMSVANAYVADVSDNANRKRNFGQLGLAANLGFLLGPTIGGLLATTALGYKLPILVAVGVSLAGTWVIAALLPESRPQKRCPESERERNASKLRRVLGADLKDCDGTLATENEKTSLKTLLQTPGVPLLLLMYFLMFAAFNVFYTGMPVHAAQTLGWDTARLGYFFAVLSCTMLLTQGPVLGYLSSRVSEKPLIFVGLLLLAGSFGVLVVADGPLTFVSAALYAVGNGLMWPSFLSVLAQAGSPEQQGALQGIAGSIGSLASILGLVVGGLAYVAFGSWTFIAAAMLMASVGGLTFGLKRG